MRYFIIIAFTIANFLFWCFMDKPFNLWSSGMSTGILVVWIIDDYPIWRQWL